MANAAAALLAGYLPGTNPYTFLRAALRETGSPVKPEWFFDLLYVLSAAFALLTLLSIFGLVLRIRQRTLWFARWVVVPSGRLLMLHPINCNAMAKFIFFAVVQIYLWRVSWAFHRTGDERMVQLVRVIPMHAIWIPFLLAGWLDMAGTVAGVIVAAFRKTGKSPRLFSVWPVHLFLYATPLLGIALLVIAFAYLGVSVSRLDAALDTIVQSLVAGEASWTPDEPLAQLLALAPEADAFSAASDATKLACRSVYIVYSCILVAMLAGALPANVYQTRTLVKQMRALRHTLKYDAPDSQPSDDTAAPAAWSGHDIVRSEAHRLIRVCIWRILTLNFHALCTISFLGFAIVLACDPWLLIQNDSISSLIILGGLFSALMVCAIASSNFVLHSVDTPLCPPSARPETSTSTFAITSPRLHRFSRSLSRGRPATGSPSNSRSPRTPAMRERPLQITVQLSSAFDADADDDIAKSTTAAARRADFAADVEAARRPSDPEAIEEMIEIARPVATERGRPGVVRRISAGVNDVV